MSEILRFDTYLKMNRLSVQQFEYTIEKLFQLDTQLMVELNLMPDS